jgi:hypothetical protein
MSTPPPSPATGTLTAEPPAVEPSDDFTLRIPSFHVSGEAAAITAGIVILVLILRPR